MKKNNPIFVIAVVLVAAVLVLEALSAVVAWIAENLLLTFVMLCGIVATIVLIFRASSWK